MISALFSIYKGFKNLKKNKHGYNLLSKSNYIKVNIIEIYEIMNTYY